MTVACICARGREGFMQPDLVKPRGRWVSERWYDEDHHN